MASDTNGVITTQIWDSWNLIEEHTASDSFQRMYFHGAAVNEIVGSYGPAYGDAFYFQDGRGNVTHLTGPGNNVIEHYTYFVSGQPNYLSGSAMNNRFLFEGSIYLPAPGIYDMRNRFYLPNLGRFMQSDPIGFDAGDMNLFRYCGNDPVDGSDPMGLEVDIDKFREDDPVRARFHQHFQNKPSDWPKTLIYAGHGDQTREHFGEVKDPRYKLNIMGAGPTISRATVAESIMHYGGFKSYAQIFLAVCSAGDPRSSVAPSLARATGKPVIAPDKMLWVTKSGYYFSADPKVVGGQLKADTTKMGTLRKFTPDGKSTVIQSFHSGPGESINLVPSSAPSAAQLEATQPGTGVPTLGAEGVNRVNATRL